jgi:hypothetical protein
LIIDGFARDSVAVLVHQFAAGIRDIGTNREGVVTAQRLRLKAQPVGRGGPTHELNASDGDRPRRSGELHIRRGESGQRQRLAEHQVDRGQAACHDVLGSVLTHPWTDILHSEGGFEAVLGFSADQVEILIERIARDIFDPGSNPNLVVCLGRYRLHIDSVDSG